MKAWLLESMNGVKGMRLADVDSPVPAAGEALLRVRYAALNPADRYLAEGQYPAKPVFPHILGRDGIGTVEAIGAGVTEFKPGDTALILRSEIGVSRRGTFAERVAVPVESLVRPPAGWSDPESAAAPLVYLTALQALTQWGELPRGSVVLVTGASGGVGVASVQLGHAMGLRVIGLSRSAEKSEKLRQIGAEACLDPADTTWRATLKNLLGKQRVDLAIDNIGGSLFSEIIDTLGLHGRVSVVGRLAGPVPEFNTASLFFRRIRIGGVAVGTYTPAEAQAGWTQIVSTLDGANARPLIDSIHPFGKLLDAFDRLHAGPMGKVILEVGGKSH
jgi:NADPH2:quinone reductase